MGLWNWIVGTTTGRRRLRRVCSSQGAAPDGDSATATLDPPAAPEPEPSTETTAPWWKPDDVSQTEQKPPQRPDMSSEDVALEGVLYSHLDGHDLSMPSLPRVPERVLKRLRNPNADFTKVAADIAEDQVIAAAVLRTVNSPLYRGQDRITALQPAVSRLGSKAIRTLMMNQSLRAATFQGAGGKTPLADLVWAGSLAGGEVMRGLSRFTRIDEEDASLVGLLHDIGNVIVLRLAHSQETTTHRRINIETFEYLCYEHQQEFGELVADAWKLPVELKEVIADHHAYPSPQDPMKTKRLQLQLTDMITSMLGYTRAASYNLLESQPVRDLNLAERDDFVRFLDDLPDQIEGTLSSF